MTCWGARWSFLFLVMLGCFGSTWRRPEGFPHSPEQQLLRLLLRVLVFDGRSSGNESELITPQPDASGISNLRYGKRRSDCESASPAAVQTCRTTAEAQRAWTRDSWWRETVVKTGGSSCKSVGLHVEKRFIAHRLESEGLTPSRSRLELD